MTIGFLRARSVAPGQRCILVAAIALGGCLAKPRRAYTPEEIASVQSLKELMRVQAHHADPLFAKREQGSFADDELAAMKHAGTMLRATSERVKAFAGQGDYDDGFSQFATELGAHASTLETAAERNDAATARAALEGIRSSCKGCHGVYR